MACRSKRRLWPRALSGELSGRKLKRFDAHLQVCAECRARLQACEQSRQLVLRDLPEPVELTPGEQARIRPDLTSFSKTPPHRRYLIAGLASAAAAVLLAVLLLVPGQVNRASSLDGGDRRLANAGKIPVNNRIEMRMNTSDPKVKIVWVFDRDLKL